MSNLSMLKKNGEFHTTMDGVFADPDIKEKEDRYNLPYMGRAIVLCGLIIALVWLAVR